MNFSFESDSFFNVWNKLKNHVKDEFNENEVIELDNPYPCLKDLIDNFEISKFQTCTYCLGLPVLNLEKAINNFFNNLDKGNAESIIFFEKQIELLLDVIGIIFNFCQEYRFKEVRKDKEIEKFVWFVCTSRWFAKNTLFYYGANTLAFDLITEKYQESNLQKVEKIQTEIEKCIKYIENWEQAFNEKKHKYKN